MTCPGCRKELDEGVATCGEKRCRAIANGAWHPNSAAGRLPRKEQAKLRRQMDRFNADSRAYETQLQRSNFGSYS